MGDRLFRQEDSNRLLAEALARGRHEKRLAKDEVFLKEAYERAWAAQKMRDQIFREALIKAKKSRGW